MSAGKPLETILDKVDLAVEDGSTDVKTLVESFGSRAFGPILILACLALISPVGAIPGVPLLMALIVSVVSVQILLRRQTPWAPQVLERIEINKSKTDKVKSLIKPSLIKIDGLVRPRYQWAAKGSFLIFSAILSLMLAILTVPLGAVPFGVFVPGTIFGVIGLAIVARDGLILISLFSFLALFGIVVFFL